MQLSIGQCGTLACLLEVSAPKPGNVHRGADFEDVTFYDFVVSAAVIAPMLDEAAKGGVGRTVLDAVRATKGAVGTNTNLGTVLLLAPLAAVPRGQSLADGVADVLQALNADDANLVYQAIQLANAGGLGRVGEMDVAAEPPKDLLAAMRLAAGRDLVARQYAENFEQVFQDCVPAIVAGRKNGWSLIDTIIHTQLHLLSQYPDSLIARKCGREVALEVSEMASGVLRSGQPTESAYNASLADFDFWLRSDGHRRNPGTTADLIAAGLFVAFRDELIDMSL